MLTVHDLLGFWLRQKFNIRNVKCVTWSKRVFVEQEIMIKINLIRLRARDDIQIREEGIVKNTKPSTKNSIVIRIPTEYKSFKKKKKVNNT